jgi:hypothetical protein
MAFDQVFPVAQVLPFLGLTTLHRLLSFPQGPERWPSLKYEEILRCKTFPPHKLTAHPKTQLTTVRNTAPQTSSIVFSACSLSPVPPPMHIRA